MTENLSQNNNPFFLIFSINISNDLKRSLRFNSLRVYDVHRSLISLNVNKSCNVLQAYLNEYFFYSKFYYDPFFYDTN